MLIVWRLDKRVAQEIVGCIFDVCFDIWWLKSLFACVSHSSCRACPWARQRYVILLELITNSWLLTMCTASCMPTRCCPAKWCNACFVIVLTPLILSSCVLFVVYNGKCIANQVIRVIQNLNNAFIDLREDVHIIQYSNITSYLYSLYDDILDSIYLSLWRVVSLTSVWHHISQYIFYFTYIRTIWIRII